MNKESQNGMQCSQFEMLLPDVLDGLLPEEVSSSFHAHARSCPACGAIFAEARRGLLWLQALEDVEPPQSLVHNILAVTRIAEVEEQTAVPAFQPGWMSGSWKLASSVFAGALQPRFATSFSMAFFSLSLILTLAGVRLKDLAQVDWHPSTLSKSLVLQYTQVESRFVRYYNNMRLVYEIESRVGELKRAEEKNDKPEQPKFEKKKKDNTDTSGRPEQRQDYYSRHEDDAVFACLIPIAHE